MKKVDLLNRERKVNITQQANIIAVSQEFANKMLAEGLITSGGWSDYAVSMNYCFNNIVDRWRWWKKNNN